MDWSLPPFLRDELGPLRLWQWGGIVLSALAGVAAGLGVAAIVRRAVEHIVRRTPVPWDDKLAEAIRAPVRVWCALVASYLLLGPLKLPAPLLDDLAKLTRAGTISVVVWALIRCLYALAGAVADGTLGRETMDPERLIRARSLRTQIIVATRVASALLFVVGAALVALQFNVVRSVGMSLLASAGVAGVVLGFAAQKSLGALLAGIQISLSQPIRIGDSVKVQDEFGTIEDIGLTYVTVRVWDERRLIVPTPRFLDQPFENWSRTSAGLLGTVLLKVDFDVPLARMRAEFERLMDHEPRWDGRTKTMQVTDVGEKALEVRLLVSARTPGDLWELRTSVREKLVLWMQELEHGAHLPRTRLQVSEPSRARTSVVERPRPELRPHEA